MSSRNEDFDEYCDPNKPRQISYQDILKASEIVRKHMPPTPCIARGAVTALEMLPRAVKKVGIIISSLGNQAMGICHFAKLLGIPVTVVMPLDVPITKMQKCHNYGAKLIIQGENLPEAQKIARQIARDKGLIFVNGRDHPNIIAGYGTIALEILEQVPLVDAILVPVGAGGLAAGIATVMKQIKPECLIYGVQSDKLPTFFKSLEAGESVELPWENSIAESVAMSNVGVNSFSMLQSLLDKMLLVKEDWIARAILHLIEKERIVVEGAGACPLAAIIGNLVPEFKVKNVVCIASGGNIDVVMLGRCVDRGLAAEGRLVKFKVGIRDHPSANEQLCRLLSSGGYNVVRQFFDKVWVEDDIYRFEAKMVCETTGLEHALELKRIIERAYPRSAVFETEPLNDTRTCPCFVRKNKTL